jgi:hypothetical protein
MRFIKANQNTLRKKERKEKRKKNKNKERMNE